MLIFETRRLWLLPTLVCTLFLGACTPTAEHNAAALVPVQSPNDDREYRYLELDNKLKVLLISDPDTKKGAAALDVYVGSAQNPVDRAGLAHFLEHMLFLGTDKYPDAAEYEEFITEHGGSRNAYTAFEHTNYFFDIKHTSLEPALDRFAQFFIAPRFDAQYVDREVNAVEAEYQLGLKTDGRRNLDVLREVVNPEHPFSILGVGTKDTLADRADAPIRESLLAFYDRYYSANLMTLVVLGQESLDELEAIVRPMFGAVPNKERQVERIEQPLYLPQTLPSLVYIRPEASQRQLQLSFPMPDYSDHFRRKSLEFVAHLIGHEGEGSLLSLLKSKGWAETLGTGAGLRYRGGSAFGINITLTEQGMVQREQVLYAVFQYIEMLDLAGPSEQLYREEGQIAGIQFRFRESGDPIGYVAGLANDLHQLPPAEVLRGNLLMDEFTPEEIKAITREHLRPEQALITVIGKEVPVDRQSEFYFTEYSVTPAPADSAWLAVASDDIDASLHLPAPNAFIAEDVSLRPLPEQLPELPQLLRDSGNLKLWYRQDDEFRIPKGALYTNFRSPVVNSTVEQAAAVQLYVGLLTDAVNEFAYPAQLAGLNFSLYRHARGISLKVSGYNDKQLVLLQQIVEAIAGADLDTDRFTNIRDDLVRNLENVKTRRPFSQAIGAARQLLVSGEYSEPALIAELQDMTPQQVQAMADQFWADVQADVLLHGNYSEQAIAGVEQALSPLLTNGQPRPPAALEVVRLQPGDNFVHPVAVEHDDSVVFWYRQGPDNGWGSRAMTSLSGQITKSGFFQQLRTEQQLGYVVSALYWPQYDVPALGFVIQSPSASAPQVAVAIDAFLEGTLSGEQAITAEQFERHKLALINEIQQPHKNLWEESEYFWSEIAKRDLDFDGREQWVAAVESIEFDAWQAWFQTHMVDSSAAVLFTTAGRWGEVPDGQVIDSPEALRSQRESFLVD
ncbi:peptidase M16 [Halieaceae bacterium IMCC14734]|uniref:Protease 3 n=1 Tax=Candidatus Litorirhabdus singularis TaxID=2518993 RepID=A0ABT3TPB7_9GAMM|nr:insulinase family protein [Candidatus Litorirhabdus singularis]MCX2983249.1 peptidase M16 [Candidatus Litorirhabdus singularis]